MVCLCYSLGTGAHHDYSVIMVNVLPALDVPMRPETKDELEARLTRERFLAAEADADIDCGLGIDWPRAEAWLRALDQDQELPLPTPTAARP